MSEVHSRITSTGDGKVTTTLTVHSAFDQQSIWRCLVMPDQLSNWLGHVAAPLTQGTEFVLAYLNGSDHRTVGEVLVSDAPTTLEFTWRFNGSEESRVRIDLLKTTEGTDFVLVHSGVVVDEAAANAATWHAQIEFLSRWLNDHLALGAALRERRNELLPQYENELERALLVDA